MGKIPFAEQCLQQIQTHCNHDFVHGMIAGLVLAVAILLVLLLLCLLCSRANRVITIRKDNQTLRFTEKTVRAYIENLIRQDGRLIIDRVMFNGRKSAFHILLKVSLTDAVNETFPVIADQLRTKILTELRDNIGINTVKSVDFELLSLNIPQNNSPE